MCSSRIGRVGIGLVGIEFVLAWLVGIGRAGIGFVLGWLVGTGRVGIDLVGIGLADDGKGRPAPRANAPLSTPGQVRSKETPAMLIAITIVIAKLHFQSLFKCNTCLTCQGSKKIFNTIPLGCLIQQTSVSEIALQQHQQGQA